jgi:hypothetical protein
VDRTQHAEGVKAIPPLPPDPGEELDETDQGKVMYRRGDGDASADEPEP